MSILHEAVAQWGREKRAREVVGSGDFPMFKLPQNSSQGIVAFVENCRPVNSSSDPWNLTVLSSLALI